MPTSFSTLPPNLQSSYTRDPRRNRIQTMQDMALNRKVEHPMQGLAKLLMAYNVREGNRELEADYEKRGQEYSKAMADALGMIQPSTKEVPPFGHPAAMDYKPATTEDVPGDFSGAAGLLAQHDPALATQFALTGQARSQTARDTRAKREYDEAQAKIQHGRAKELKAMTAEKPPKTIKTGEGVFILNTDGTLGERLGSAKADTEIILGGELKKGFRPVKDPTTGEVIGAEAIPGGSEDPATIQTKKEAERKAALNIKNLEKLPARRSQIFAANQNAPAFEDAVKDATKLAKGWKTSGVMQQILGGVAGTDAFALERALDTIKSNIGFGELLRIKEAGGTLGALSEMENRLLQAMQGALDPRLDGEKLATALERVGEIHKQNLEQKKLEFKDMYPDEARPWEGGGATGAIPTDLVPVE